MRGHKMAAAAHRQGPAGPEIRPDHRLCQRGHRARRHIHTHNCSFAEFERDYAFAQDAREETLLPAEQRATFEGFRRGNGKAGTRNYIGILTSVNCSASVARFMAEAVNRSGILARLPQRRRRRLRSCTAPAAGWPARARATRRWSARNGATPAIPTSPPRWSSGLGCEVFQIARLKEQVRPDRGRQLPHHDHPGHRRHEEDHRGRRRRASRRCCRAPTQVRRETHPGQRAHASRCNAAARTAIPASPPTRRSAPPSTCSCATAARRCCPRRPRSTAPSTC